MKGSRTINSELNKVLGVELIAINQYFLHAKILKNWGYEGLADKEWDASIDVMKESDKLIERILFLEGLPNLQDLGKLNIGQTVPEILKSDMTLEISLRNKIAEATQACEKEQDYVSRDLLAELLEESEERIDFYETQLDLVTQLGIQNYLQTAVGEIEE
ncbi:MAG: bacterioferritin [Bdellovibrionia bacterium]